MPNGRKLPRWPALLLVLLAVPCGLGAETLVERSLEARFQLDLQVSPSALQAFLPDGWSQNVAQQGNARDANLRVIFVDRLTINAADGRPVGSGSRRLVYLAVPVKDAAGESAQLIIAGLEAAGVDPPSMYPDYQRAARHHMRRSAETDGHVVLETQDWSFEGPSDEKLEMHVQFERGVANRSAISDVKFYSAANPALVEISRQEQVLEILRNVTTNPRDRVREFSFRASGGVFSKIFDGSERVLSWDNIVWINRSVSKPEGRPQ